MSRQKAVSATGQATAMIPVTDPGVLIEMTAARKGTVGETETEIEIGTEIGAAIGTETGFGKETGMGTVTGTATRSVRLLVTETGIGTEIVTTGDVLGATTETAHGTGSAGPVIEMSTTAGGKARANGIIAGIGTATVMTVTATLALQNVVMIMAAAQMIAMEIVQGAMSGPDGTEMNWCLVDTNHDSVAEAQSYPRCRGCRAHSSSVIHAVCMFYVLNVTIHARGPAFLGSMHRDLLSTSSHARHSCIKTLLSVALHRTPVQQLSKGLGFRRWTRLHL